MAEPENHTLHLLREIRGDIKGLDCKLDDLHRKIVAFAGEIAGRTCASGGVERRLADIEKRLTALEQSK